MIWHAPVGSDLVRSTILNSAVNVFSFGLILVGVKAK